MQLFLVSALSLLAAGSCAYAAAVAAYPYRTELFAYSPVHGEFPVVNALTPGYVRFIDQQGVEHLTGYKYPAPVQSQSAQKAAQQLDKGIDQAAAAKPTIYLRVPGQEQQHGQAGVYYLRDATDSYIKSDHPYFLHYITNQQGSKEMPATAHASALSTLHQANEAALVALQQATRDNFYAHEIALDRLRLANQRHLAQKDCY